MLPRPSLGRGARRLLAVALAGVSALLLAGCGSARPTITAGPDHPNVVLVLVDDYAMNLLQQMPNLQSMRAAGMTMSRYYVVDSLCCPSRSALLTGRYPHDTGVYTNAGTDGGISAYEANGGPQRCFAVPLHDAGYRTAFMGKYLNGYVPQTMDPQPGWDRWVAGGAGGYREYGYTLNEDGKRVHYGHADRDYMVDVLSRKAAAFVRQSARQQHPFALEVATYAPHAPFVPPRRYAGTLAGVPYPKTPAYDAEVRNAPSWLRGHVPLTAAEKTLMAKQWEGRLEADRAVDDMIGNLRRTVQRAGVAGSTYFVFTSDNGLHMGEYRLTAGKETAYDTDVHVPLIVVGPGVPAGSTSDALASEIDLAPTLLTLAGLKPDPAMDGVGLDTVWHGRTPDDWQRGVLIEHRHRQGVPTDPDLQNARSADPPGYEAVRTRDSLYVRYLDGEQEYYDTVADPYQLQNLGAEAVPPRLKRMLGALERCHGSTACQAAARTG